MAVITTTPLRSDAIQVDFQAIADDVQQKCAVWGTAMKGT
jgi:hypothetical protein